MSFAAQVAVDLLRNAWPSVLSNVIQQVNGLVTFFFVTGLDDAYILGAVGLGAMAQNVFGFSLGMGVNAALETLVSQSNGAGQHGASASHLRQAQTVSLIISVPCMLGLLFAEDFFLAVGINPMSARYAGQYVKGTILSMPFAFLDYSTRLFLRAIKNPRPSFYVSILVAVLHPLWCVVFLRVLGWGAFGAGCTQGCSNIVSFMLLTCYVAVVRPGVCKQAWQCFPWPRGNCGAHSQDVSEASGQGMVRTYREFLAVALASGMLLWSEWWVYEIMSLLAGLCGVEALAAHMAVCNLLLVLFMVPMALGSATSALVGNAIGAGDLRKVRTTIRLSSSFMLFTFLVVGAVVAAIRTQLARVFSSSEGVVQIFATLCLILGPFLVVDSVQTVIEGALRGLGLQARATRAKLFSMIGVRLLGAYTVGIALHVGIVGIWMASLLGMVVTIALYLSILRGADLEEIMAETQRRVALSQANPGGDEEANPGGSIRPGCDGSAAIRPTQAAAQSS